MLSIWTGVGFIPVVGPIIAALGKAIMTPVTGGLCMLSHQPGYVVSAVCTLLSGNPCN